MTQETELLNVQQASKLIGVSPKTIRRWAQAKKVRGLKVGTRGDWRFTKDDLLKVVKVSNPQ
jgi:excisionase family DNA binding protein